MFDEKRFTKNQSVIYFGLKVELITVYDTFIISGSFSDNVEYNVWKLMENKFIWYFQFTFHYSFIFSHH